MRHSCRVESAASTAVVAFALGVLPGVLVLELLEFTHRPIRERTGVRAFGYFLLLSIVVWVVAVLVFGVDAYLAEIVGADEGTSGQEHVDAYLGLGWRLLVTSLAVGAICHLSYSWLERFAEGLVHKQAEGRPVGRVAISAAGLVSAKSSWDVLLAHVQRTGAAQLVHVKFVDGSEAYGLFAGNAHADLQADGRGIVLDTEFVLRNGALEPVPNSRGLFIAPDNVLSVGFSEYR